MEREASSSNAVVILAIIAVLVLVGVGVWFFSGRPGGRTQQATPGGQSSQRTEEKSDVEVKVDLPDTIRIK